MTSPKTPNKFESVEELVGIFDLLTDALFITDLEGKFLEVNQVACERLGYSKDELLQMELKDINTPEYTSLYQDKDLLVNLKESETIVLKSTRLIKKEKQLPIEIKLRGINYKNKKAILYITIDIKERIVTDIQEIFDKFFNSLPELMFLTDINGIIKECNDSAKVFFNLSEHEFIGKKIFKFFNSPEILHFYLEQIRPETESEQNLYPAVYKILKNSLWFNVYLILFFLPNTKEPYVLINVQDITDTIKHERENVQFLLTFSHEIANRLEHIINYLNSIEKFLIYLEKNKLSKRLKKKFDQTNLAFDQLKLVIELLNNTARKFISYKKMESQEDFKKIRISKIIKTIKNSLEETYSQYGISFNIINKIPNDFKYYTNELIMETIFRNLLDNSIRYRVVGTTPEVIITHNVDFKKNLLYFRVQDNGIGFTEEEIKENLFKFSQVRSTEHGKEGFHVGLSEIKRIIENRFKGRIEAFSLGRNKGSTFTITLPYTFYEDKESSEMALCELNLLKENYKRESILCIFHAFLYNFDLFIVSEENIFKENLVILEDVFVHSESSITILNNEKYNEIRKRLTFENEMMVSLDSNTIEFHRPQIHYKNLYKDLLFESHLYGLLKCQKPLSDNFDDLKECYIKIFDNLRKISKEYHKEKIRFKKTNKKIKELETMIGCPIKDIIIDRLIERNFGVVPIDVKVSHLF